MVRLKALNGDVSAAHDAYFNSTMVRLKALGRRYGAQPEAFQFHYGTIKSPMTC